jgi:hypothetical protein
MPTVEFVDTSVLLNLCRVPNKCQQHEEVKREFAAKVGGRSTLVLPLTAVIETGNLIAQVDTDRRRCAEAFETIVRSVFDDQVPWVLNEVPWDGDFLRRLCDGPGHTGRLVDVLTRRELGTGDLAILVEVDLYRARVRRADVRIWTYDERLRGYE